DGSASDTQSFTIAVANVNDAPVIVSPPVTGATQDQSYTYNVVASDDDAGDVLTFTGTTIPAWLNLVDNGDGTATLSGTPSNSDVGLHPVEIRVDDSAGLFDIQSFNIDVRNTNDPPVAVDDAYVGSEGGTLVTSASGLPRGVLFNDIDPDGDALTSFIVTNPSNGSLTLNLDGSFTYVHDGSETITDSFEYFATDGTFVSNTATAVITITPVNDPPAFSSTPVTSATQGVAYRYDITTQDPDGPSVSLSAPTLPSWLTLNDNGDGTGELVGTPSNSEVGVHSVVLEVSDGAESRQQSFSITVSDVNDPPTITSSPVTSATQDVQYTYDLTATDPDGNPLTYSATTLPAWLTLSDNGDGTARLRGTPGNGDVGANNVVVQVSDGAATDQQSFTVTVANVNDAPGFTSSPVTAATQDVAYAYNATTSDPDGDAVTITAVTKPAWLAFADNDDGTATLSGTPSNSDVGVHAVTLRVSDGSLTEDQSFSITVSDVNEAPAFTSSPVTAAVQDSPYSYTITASDPDGNALSFSAPTLPAWLTLMDQGDGTATLSGTPADSNVGSHPVVLRVSDGTLTDEQSFSVVVANVNDAPTFTSTPVTSATQDSPYSYAITTEDVDGDDLAITAETLPAWLAFADAGDGTATLNGTPTNTEIGVHPVTLRVSDGSLSTEQNFSITVNNQNDPPAITSTPVTEATEDVTYVYNLTATDPDPGTSLAYSAPTLPIWMALFDNGDGTATLTGTPRDRHVGDHAVVISVTDGLLSDQQSFSVTVSNVNDPPVFVSSPVTAATQDEVYLYDVDVSDEDGDPIVFTAPVLPGWLTLTDNDDGTATLRGTPTNDDIGVHSVVIRTSDGTVAVDQSFSVTVANVNDPPIFTSAPVTEGTEDEAYQYAVTAADPDAGSSVTLSATTLPSWLTFTDNGGGAGTLSGTPTNSDVGSHSVVLQASDGSLTGSQSFTVTIANVNDSPQFVSPPVTGALQGQLYTYDVVASDEDPGDEITLTATTLPSWLSFTDNGDGTGQLRGSPTNANVGEHPVELRAVDSADAFDVQSFTITVRNTNDAPVALADAYTIDEGATLSATGTVPGVLANDNDPDGDQLTATLVTGVSNGSLNLNLDGTFEYVHDGGETTSDSFEYIANDGIFVSNLGTVQITVNPVNDPPEITSAPVRSASQGVEYVYDVQTSDPDGPLVSLTATTLPDWLGFVDNGDGTGTLTGTPGNNDVGVHPVVITASDGVDSSQQSYSIDVGNTNDPPVFTSTPVTAAVQNQEYRYDASAIDPDGDQVTFSAPTIPSWMQLVDNGDGTAALTGTPSPSDVGGHSVVIEATDGVETTSQSFTVTVVDVNDPPQFTSDPVLRAVQDRSYVYAVTTEDPDGDTVALSAPQIPVWMSFSDNGDGTATLSGTPAESDLGDHAVILRASDGVESVNQEFTVTVDNGNSIPVAQPDTYPLDEGGTINGNAGRAPRGILDNDSDADGDDLSAVLVEDVQNGVLALQGDGSFSYTHDGSETTTDSFTYQASDGRDLSEVTKVTFNIIPVNDRPVARDDDFVVTEDETVVLNLLQNDDDAEGAVTLDTVLQPTLGSVVVTGDSTVTFTPAAEYNGPDSFRYTVVDDDGAVSDTATVSITVTPVNDSPIASNDAVTTGESAPVVVNVLANDEDPDGDPLTVTSVTEPSNGTAIVGTIAGTVRYTPADGFLGEDRFTYTVEDGNGGNDVAEVVVTVTSLKFAIDETGTIGGAASRGFAINDEGQVVGTSILPSGQVKAFLWEGGNIRDLEPDLSRGSQAYGVNESGIVVGAVEENGGIAAARWDVGAEKSESTLLEGMDGQLSVALDVNESGDVVGTALSGDNQFHPVIWQGSALTVISADGVDVGQAEAISSDGEIVGSVLTPTSAERAIRGELGNVRQLSSEDSRAYGINGLGMAVGSKVSGTAVTAVSWSSNGLESELSTPGSRFAEAYGVNDSGWIVGAMGDDAASSAAKTTSRGLLLQNDPLFTMTGESSISADFSKSMTEVVGLTKSQSLELRAALWVGGNVLDLNALIPEASGWTLVEARDVNNAGQITGYGLFQGAPRAFVLTLTGNEAPAGKDDHVTTFVGEPLTIDLLANDSDADGDTLSVIAVTSPAYGSIDLVGGSRAVYRPIAGFIGEDSFTYTVADGKGGSATAEVFVTVEEEPKQFELAQNYPNPFNPTTTIEFVLPSDANVTLQVFDGLGRAVATLIDEDRSRGRHRVLFDAGSLSSGIYLYRIHAGSFSATRKLILVK
ncbi:MAG: tandem-95 repeat protein, partial [Rhodothermia bacterium]|nr:tandem-95 repeat protein [Rhodothermia bacterium]